jgi:hypothetical protein
MHRGRLQSQGGPVNDSEPWNQNKPLTRNKGIFLSHRLEAKPTKTENKLRSNAFSNARAFMKAAHKKGGVGVTSKTYMVKGDPHHRVDIEVRLGLAFK